MDHEVYESQMIDGVNRNAEEKSQHTITFDSPITTKKNPFARKKNVQALGRGLKRVVIALLTAVLFALSVYSFIAVATATGYWAVVLFASGIVLLVWTYILLCAQGVVPTESKGDDK